MINDSFKALLKSGMAAAGLAPSTKKQLARDTRTIVTNKVVNRQPMGHVIREERLGPYFKQVGVTADGKRRMYKHFIHRYLHATKGWRTKSYSMGTSIK